MQGVYLAIHILLDCIEAEDLLRIMEEWRYLQGEKKAAVLSNSVFNGFKIEAKNTRLVRAASIPL